MEKTQRLMTVILLGLVMLALAVPFVSAAALSGTWNPTTVGNYSNLTTSFSYNCTISAHAVLNVTVYANSSSGVMNALQVFTNASAAQTAWTGTVSIQAADDGSNQNLSCYADNGTDQAYSTEKSASRIRLDSTAPKCNITILHPTIAYAGKQTITYYSSDALARRTTTLDIDGPGKQTLVTSTNQNGPVELGSNDTKYTGSWTVNMTVTDWSGNSCTDSATFKSYMPNGVGGAEEEPVQKDMKGILVIIGLAVLAYFVLGKKR